MAESEAEAWLVAAAPWRREATLCNSAAARTPRMTAMTTRVMTVARLVLDRVGVEEDG